jgi:hypothetical protein
VAGELLEHGSEHFAISGFVVGNNLKAALYHRGRELNGHTADHGRMLGRAAKSTSCVETATDVHGFIQQVKQLVLAGNDILTRRDADFAALAKLAECIANRPAWPRRILAQAGIDTVG